MIKVQVLKIDMSVNSADKLGYPRYPLSLRSTWEDPCENRWSLLNKEDIISCYPCQIVEPNGRNKKEAWKVQLRGQEEPLYCLDIDLIKGYITEYRGIPIDEKLKALDIIKEKRVDVDLLIRCLNSYCIDSAHQEYNQWTQTKRLTHEECVLLKKVLL